MSAPTPVPVTPEQRRSVLRTFIWILVGFVALIGLLVATFTFQGRAARDYGSKAVKAALATNPSPNISYEQDCAVLLGQPLPDTITACTVKVADGKAEALLTTEAGEGGAGGKVYRVTR